MYLQLAGVDRAVERIVRITRSAADFAPGESIRLLQRMVAELEISAPLALDSHGRGLVERGEQTPTPEVYSALDTAVVEATAGRVARLSHQLMKEAEDLEKLRREREDALIQEFESAKDAPCWMCKKPITVEGVAWWRLGVDEQLIHVHEERCEGELEKKVAAGLQRGYPRGRQYPLTKIGRTGQG